MSAPLPELLAPVQPQGTGQAQPRGRGQALNLGALVGAVAIIEPIFSLPGVGAILISSITNHDVPIVEGVVLVFAVVVVLAAMAADLLYAVLDPRIRYERSDS